MSSERKTVDLSSVDELVRRVGGERHRVVPLLQAVQREYRYLPREVLERVCEISEITPAQIAGVASFYPQFRFTPGGEHRICVCHGTACHSKGSERVHDAFMRRLGIPDGADTDPERRFTIEKVACLGCCTLAPVVQIDNTVYGHLTPEQIAGVLDDFLEREAAGARKGRLEVRDKARVEGAEIRIGMGSCCVAKRSDALRDSLESALAGLGVSIPVKRVGCVGMCHRTPLVEIVTGAGRSVLYAEVRPDDAMGIVSRHFRPRGPWNRVRRAAQTFFAKTFTDEAWESVSRYSIDVRDEPVEAFLGRQVHIATEHFGHLDPFDFDEYRSRGGFEALEYCLRELNPDGVIRQVEECGLRGRGGGGYPTGRKWKTARDAAGSPKYVICNGDEGDPGAFMDRMLLESFPYRVIEGMAIAAYAVGASEGILYVRAEYGLALLTLREALAECERRGYLGDNTAGTGFTFHLGIVEGAGAFISGEETALIASLEGNRSTPRPRPPYPAESGFRGCPTLVNNVETFSIVPWVLRNGPGAFARLGSRESNGTKVFALAGKVARGGLIEVPMGMTIREIVEGIGGGIQGGKRFKAVQIGGPSGGCVPAGLADTAVDFDSLQSVGAMMGSGGFVVLDETDCMVDIARYFLTFTQDQSCGKCTFCRVGSKRMLEILVRICEGEGKPEDLDRLEEIAAVMKKASFCGLGRTAPNPVITSLRHFRDEYEAHLEGRCPAGRCRKLITYIITDDCIGCTLCHQHCPADAIPLAPYEVHQIDTEKCIRCGTCLTVCPEDAVRVE